MKHNLFWLLALLAGCAEAPPAVSEFNGHSVKIQQSTIFNAANPDDPQVVAEAQRICGKVAKRAEHASFQVGPNAAYSEHLFLCI